MQTPHASSQEKTHQDLAQFLNNTFELNENDLVDYEEKLSVLPI